MPLDRVMSRSFHVTQQCGFLMKERISEHHGKGVGTKFKKKTADARMYIVHIYRRRKPSWSSPPQINKLGPRSIEKKADG
jgi:hypothetical protein